MQDYFKETYGRETHFIPNGVNRPEVRKAKLIRDNFGLEKDSYILFLGRLVPEKGIRYLVEAFKNVKTDKKLVIAGGSSDTDSFMEELKDLAKGDDQILFTGFVQGAMLDELYSNAYIYTLPSDLEGISTFCLRPHHKYNYPNWLTIIKLLLLDLFVKTLVSNSNSIIGSHIFGAIVTLCVAFRTEQNRL